MDHKSAKSRRITNIKREKKLLDQKNNQRKNSPTLKQLTLSSQLIVNPSKSSNSKEVNSTTTWLSKETAKRKATEMMARVGKKSKDERKELFDKYGVLIPSFDKIKKDHKLFERQKRCLESLNSLNASKSSIKLDDFKESKEEIISLDCHHLSNTEIEEYFEDFQGILDNIVKKKKFSLRHRKYIKSLVDLKIKDKDRINVGQNLIIFTDEQIDLIVNLVTKKFDPNYEKQSYIFNVLVPEFCLLVFKTVHNMTMKEAVAYLDNRPC